MCLTNANKLDKLVQKMHVDPIFKLLQNTLEQKYSMLREEVLLTFCWLKSFNQEV